MNKQQLAWAAAHDWYIGHGTNANNEIFVKVRHDWIADHALTFTDYQKLREWAGY